MKKNTFLIFTSAILLASCGGTSGDTNGVTNEANGDTPLEVKPVNWENVLGTWIIQDEEVLTDKSLAGKEITFVQDSIFYYDEAGAPVHPFFEFDETYGPKIETVKTGEMGNAKVSNPVSMNFHESQPDKLMFTESGKRFQ
ncbi:MAG: hypothetical protein IPG07_17090 [Crocinitomicaceae bacterium]|nr:hypothetical protein [Crocinitomicaceae bacterium]